MIKYESALKDLDAANTKLTDATSVLPDIQEDLKAAKKEQTWMFFKGAGAGVAVGVVLTLLFQAFASNLSSQ